MPGAVVAAGADDLAVDPARRPPRPPAPGSRPAESRCWWPGRTGTPTRGRGACGVGAAADDVQLPVRAPRPPRRAELLRAGWRPGTRCRWPGHRRTPRRSAVAARVQPPMQVQRAVGERGRRGLQRLRQAGDRAHCLGRRVVDVGAGEVSRFGDPADGVDLAGLVVGDGVVRDRLRVVADAAPRRARTVRSWPRWCQTGAALARCQWPGVKCPRIRCSGRAPSAWPRAARRWA